MSERGLPSIPWHPPPCAFHADICGKLQSRKCRDRIDYEVCLSVSYPPRFHKEYGIHAKVPTPDPRTSRIKNNSIYKYFHRLTWAQAVLKERILLRTRVYLDSSMNAEKQTPTALLRKVALIFPAVVIRFCSLFAG